MNDTPQYRAMLTYDVEDYSKHNNSEQYVLQAAMIRLLDLAAGAAGLGLLDWKRQPQGDGEFVVLPPGIHPARLIGPFTDALRQNLDAHNAAPGPRLRLRLAIHAGPLHVDGPAGSPGRHAVESGRLVNADALRAALRAVPDANLGVIVSGTFHDDYVGQGYGGPPADRFRRVRAKVKQQSYVAYVHLPGYDVRSVPELASFDAEDGGKDASPPPRPPGDGRHVSVAGDWYGGNEFRVSGDGTSNIAGRDLTVTDRPRDRRP
ncbi:hypothetical protein Nocox_32725 [Nonomuraea coxensis DSM 45129]|uniref:Guanylate cyclase domain-containing protein n=1 Tax=Nonomuraea coxensis DSM 45129 TaxID=1122611 RepID=A0ABX8UAX9_9ACTN|nr:hypothetical protein [Nonomuraea coxensis]QYC44116.1 hypothetical protein Nocox_32725 [Nonomuraea coxensis DSM 45129]